MVEERPGDGTLAPHHVCRFVSRSLLPAQQYGGVYSTAGPFNPGADTLFYLPSIPDDSTPEQKNGFYRSFNNHFNTMIIAHEIYPGHYLQYKVASGYGAGPAYAFLQWCLHRKAGVRSAKSLCWMPAGSDGDRLTRLAHLTKAPGKRRRAHTPA